MTLDDLFDMEDRARNTCPDATIELILAELSALMSQIARLDQNHQALEAENKRLKALNYRLNTEYKKTWDVLRTYNPKDTELEYIGFETVGVLDAPNQ